MSNQNVGNTNCQHGLIQEAAETGFSGYDGFSHDTRHAVRNHNEQENSQRRIELWSGGLESFQQQQDCL
jgi:hypothetical protein